MIIGKQAILEFFDMQAKPYFAVFKRGNIKAGNALDRNDKDEQTEDEKGTTLDFTVGRERFERVLNLVSYGEYSLVLNSNANLAARGRIETDFKILITEAAQAAQPVAGIGSVSTGLTKEDAEKIADERFEKQMLKRDLEDVKAKLTTAEKDLKEAERKVNDPINTLIGKVAPYSDKIIAGFFPQAAAPVAQLRVSGVEPHSTGDGDVDAQVAMENFAIALQAARPNTWIEIIVKLTALAKDESKLAMAEKFM